MATQKERILEKVTLAFTVCEKQRFGQLLCNIFDLEDDDFFFASDNEVEEILDDYMVAIGCSVKEK